MKNISLLLLFSLFALGANATKYSKASNSAASFKIKNLGLWVKGSFKSLDIQAVFDSENASNISLKGVAKVSSISTGSSLRDKHLKDKPEFFNVKKTPTVTMESYKVEKISSTKYKVWWKITMRGVTKKLVTNMYVKPSNGGVKLSSSFVADRNFWKLGGGGFKMATVGDDVTISISTTLK